MLKTNHLCKSRYHQKNLKPLKQMIKSKFRPAVIPAFWILLSILILLTVGVLYYIFSRFNIVQKNETQIRDIVSLGAIFGFILWGFLWLKSVASIVLINKERRIITFTNYFTKSRQTYSFNDLDGYLQTVDINHKTGTKNKVICLLKNKVIIRKISGSFYSNMEELQDGLNSLDDLGFEKFGFVQKMKIFFRQPILK